MRVFSVYRLQFSASIHEEKINFHFFSFYARNRPKTAVFKNRNWESHKKNRREAEAILAEWVPDETEARAILKRVRGLINGTA